MRGTVTLAVVFSLGLWACEKEEGGGGAEPPKASKTTHSCWVEVAKRVDQITGTASGEDEAKVTTEAWAAACGKLAAEAQADCRNAERYAATEGGGSISSGGKTTYSKTITRTPKVPTVRGEARSEASKDEACRKAFADACAKAGAPGDCVATGSHERLGEGSTSTSVGF